MLKYLHEAALAGLVVPEGADKATEREMLRRRQQVEVQLSIACRAIQMVERLHCDIYAMTGIGDVVRGRGSYEYGPEGLEVMLEWPEIAQLEKECSAIIFGVARADEPDTDVSETEMAS